MTNPHLAAYLSDHLLNAEAVVNRLDHLEREHDGTPIATLAAGLREDVAADRAILESLLSSLGIARSAIGESSARLAERATRLDDPAGGGLRLLETLEALSLGIEGKRLLWRALKAAAADRVDLRDLDYATLERRAIEQRSAVEAFRQGAAKGALGGSAGV